MSQPILKKLSLGLKSDIGAPLPIIISNELITFLSFYAREQTDTGEFICLFKFDSFCYKFGYPNDEAISGHKYSDLGLEAYEFFEVMNSDWIETLREANKVHPNHSDQNFDKLRHFLFTFHDSVFECLASKYEIKKLKNKSKKEVAELVVQELFI